MPYRAGSLDEGEGRSRIEHVAATENLRGLPYARRLLGKGVALRKPASA